MKQKKPYTNTGRKYTTNMDQDIRKTYCANTDLEQREAVSIKYKDEELTYPMQIEKHVDICLKANSTILPMNYPVIEKKKKVKNQKSTGPDKIKPELYKVMGTSEFCMLKLTECLQNTLDQERKITSWKMSNTILIPKVIKPLARDLRPIALTDLSYTICMSMIGGKIDKHIKENQIQHEKQAGFTKQSIER